MSSVGPALTCLQVREGLPAGPPQDRLAGSDFCKGGAHKGDGHVNGGEPWGAAGTAAKRTARVLLSGAAGLRVERLSPRGNAGPAASALPTSQKKQHIWHSKNVKSVHV